MKKYNYKILRSEGTYTKQVENPISCMDFFCEDLIVDNGTDLIPAIRYFNKRCIFWKGAHSGAEVRKEHGDIFIQLEKEYQFFKREEKLKRILNG